MSVVSNMEITLRPGAREAAVSAFIARRVFDECAAVIPGFLGARLLEAQDQADVISVISEWRERSDYEAWLAHPVRAAQESDLAQFVASPPQTRLLSCKDSYPRTADNI